MKGGELNKCGKCNTSGSWNLSALDTCPACVREWVKDYHPKRKTPEGYALNVWADGFGNWHADITFRPALGNTSAADTVAARAIVAAKKKIRAAIVERNAQKVRRLSYRVTDNRFTPGIGTLQYLRISEN